MSELADKLRELSSLDKSVDVPSLIREAERLESQNRRLRELVREAYEEGFDDGERYAISLPYHSTGVDQSWETSAAKAALDKEGSDG